MRNVNSPVILCIKSGGIIGESDFGLGLVNLINVSDLFCLRPQTDEILDKALSRVLFTL